VIAAVVAVVVEVGIVVAVGKVLVAADVVGVQALR